MLFFIFYFFASHLALAIVPFFVAIITASKPNFDLLFCYGHAFFTNVCILSHVVLLQL